MLRTARWGCTIVRLRHNRQGGKCEYLPGAVFILMLVNQEGRKRATMMVKSSVCSAVPVQASAAATKACNMACAEAVRFRCTTSQEALFAKLLASGVFRLGDAVAEHYQQTFRGNRNSFLLVLAVAKESQHGAAGGEPPYFLTGEIQRWWMAGVGIFECVRGRIVNAVKQRGVALLRSAAEEMLIEPRDDFSGMARRPAAPMRARLRSAACKLAIISAAEMPFPLMSARAIPSRAGASGRKS